MGPGYDIHFDCAADEGYSDDLWLMERRHRATALHGIRRPSADTTNNERGHGG